MTKYKNEDSELRLADMFYAVLLQWRKILLIMVILGIGLAGYRYQSYLKDISDEKSTESEAVTLPSNYTDEQIKDLDQTATSIKEYQKLLDSEVNYYDNSILMKIDWTSVTHIKLQYRIVLESPSYSNLYLLVHSYEAKLYSNEFHILAASKANCNSTYIAELVNVYDIIPQPSTSIYSSVSSDQLSSESLNTAILGIEIYGPSEDFCNSIATAVQSTVDDAHDTISNDISTHSISNLLTFTAVEMSTDIQSKQMNTLSSIDSIKKTLSSKIGSLSSAELAYINANKESSPVSSSSAILLTKSQLVKKIVKNSLIGIAAGLILAGFYFCLRYLSNSKLSNIYLLEDTYRIPSYTLNYPVAKSMNRFDQYLFKKRYKDIHLYNSLELQKMIKAELETGQKTRVHDLFIVGSHFTDSDLKFIEEFKLLMKDSQINIEAGDGIFYSPEHINLLSASDGVILMETIKQSSATAIDKEIQYLTIKEKKILSGIISL